MLLSRRRLYERSNMSDTADMNIAENKPAVMTYAALALLGILSLTLGGPIISAKAAEVSRNTEGRAKLEARVDGMYDWKLEVVQWMTRMEQKNDKILEGISEVRGIIKGWEPANTE